MKKSLLIICFGFGLLSAIPDPQKTTLPKGFVYLSHVVPNIVVELRYFSKENFVAKRVNGYKKEVAIISEPAAFALSKVQIELNKRHLRLKVFDAYRPQKAVDHFVRWAKNMTDTTHKHIYYPEVDKADLFKLDYIASKSGHTRGSTIDVTLVDSENLELDMGTPWDFFGTKSWPSDTTISKVAQQNRTYLREVMLAHGFVPYEKEWWHFTLKNEPFPDTYFDFNVK